jgi:hypothetical protein
MQLKYADPQGLYEALEHYISTSGQGQQIGKILIAVVIPEGRNDLAPGVEDKRSLFCLWRNISERLE